jgi:hypothetical protein
MRKQLPFANLDSKEKQHTELLWPSKPPDTPASSRGRKPAASSAIAGSDLSAILTAVKNAEKDRLQMRAALEKIGALIDAAIA